MSDINSWYGINYGDEEAYPFNKVTAGHLYVEDGLVEEVVVPDGVSRIEPYAFKNCVDLKKVTLGANVSFIGDYAFYGCSSLDSIISNATVKPTVKDNTFNQGKRLIVKVPTTELKTDYEKDNSKWSDLTIVGPATPDPDPTPDPDDDGNQDGGNTDDDKDDKEDTKEDYSGPDFTVETENGQLICLNYDNKTQEFRVTAGSYCGDIVIPDSVYGIPVTGIEEKAFCGCDCLTSVEIPSSMKSIGAGAFDSCSNLTKVVTDDIASWCGISFGSETANPLYTAGHLYVGGTKVKDLVVPDGVESIGAFTFAGCEDLQTVTIPEGVKSVGAGAFEGCDNVTKVVTEDIGSWCEINFGSATANPLSTAGHLYEGNTLVEEVVVPDNAERIGSYAFTGCTDLKAVTVPGSVKSVGAGAFDGCTGLTKVVTEDIASWCEINFENVESNPLLQAGHLYNEDGTEVKDLVVPENVTSIGKSAFAGCVGLKSVTIGGENSEGGVKNIGFSAFYGCSNLTSLDLGSVESIGTFAFVGCDRLDSINIPSSVTSIGDLAFFCNSLTKVSTEIENPFEIFSSAFTWNTLYNGTLYVPDGTVAKYKSTGGWKEFRNIKGGVLTGTEGIEAEGVTVQTYNGALHISGAKDGTRVTVYSMTGAMVGSGNVTGGTAAITTSLRKGDIAVVRIGETSVKIIMQ